MQLLIFIVTGGAFLAVVITAILQWLWNLTMPDVFGLPPISFWNAFRLLIITALLTSGGFVRFTLVW